MTTCPTCGASRPTHGVEFVAATGSVTYAGKSCKLRPIQIDILEELLDAYPTPVKMSDLFAEFFPHQKNKERRRRTIFVHVSVIRRQFQDAGMPLEILICERRTAYALVIKDSVSV